MPAITNAITDQFYQKKQGNITKIPLTVIKQNAQSGGIVPANMVTFNVISVLKYCPSQIPSTNDMTCCANNNKQ